MEIVHEVSLPVSQIITLCIFKWYASPLICSIKSRLKFQLWNDAITKFASTVKIACVKYTTGENDGTADLTDSEKLLAVLLYSLYYVSFEICRCICNREHFIAHVM